jgi:co-chaperonin GroES (HSP10)
MSDSQLLELVTRDTPERAPEALAGLRDRNLFDFVQCMAWKQERRVIALSGSIMAPTMHEITGSDASRDKPFIGEVLSTGPGLAPETICVAPGDVFLCTLHNISYRLTERGRKTYMVRNGVIYAKVDKETVTVKPLQDLILVKRNEERALAHQSGGPIWLPTDDMSTDDVRSPAITAAYGEVVAVGPGRYRDGKWSEPPCRIGDLILYDASYSTLPITIRGESFTLVPTPQLVKIADAS